MLPSEQRARLVRLLATIDQQIAEAESLSSDPELSESELPYATAQLDFRRKAVERVEAMLIPCGRFLQHVFRRLGVLQRKLVLAQRSTADDALAVGI